MASFYCQQILKAPERSIAGLSYESGAVAWQCDFSRDGKYLAACFGAPDPCVRIWEYDSQSQEFIPHATLAGVQTRTIRSIAWAPVASPLILASASFDGTVAIWECDNEDAREWDCTAQLEGHDSEVKCVCWNATGSLIATSGRDKTVWIWECFLPGTVGGPANGDGDFECIAVLHGHEQDVKCVRFANSHGQWGDGEEILLSSSYDDTIKIWAEDAGDWFLSGTVENVHTATIWTMTLSPGSIRLVSGSDDGSIAIFKCYTAAEKRERFPDEAKGRNGLWKCVGTLSGAHEGATFCVDYAPAKAGHGRLASCGADNRIQIFREAMDSTSDRPLFSLDASTYVPEGDVNCVKWHPINGSLLASAGDDGCVRIWNFHK